MATKRTGTKVDVYQAVTDRMIEKLESGTLPWRKPWSTLGPPRNMVSGKVYRGVNVLLLAMSDYDQPYWLTYKQAHKLGGHVNKGERSTMIVFWKWLEKDEVDEATGETVHKRIPFLRYHRVFNIEQTNLEPPQVVEEAEYDPIQEAEAIVEAYTDVPTIKHKGDRACYAPMLDEVTMPKMGRFESVESYYSTLFHELTHSTGHSSRLNREELMAGGHDKDAYCKEELIAEMSASFLRARAGIEVEQTEELSAAYLQGWLKKLREDKRFVLIAAQAAQKAADYIAGDMVEAYTETTEEDGEDEEAREARAA